MNFIKRYLKKLILEVLEEQDSNKPIDKKPSSVKHKSSIATTELQKIGNFIKHCTGITGKLSIDMKTAVGSTFTVDSDNTKLSNLISNIDVWCDKVDTEFKSHGCSELKSVFIFLKGYFRNTQDELMAESLCVSLTSIFDSYGLNNYKPFIEEFKDYLISNHPDVLI